MSARILIVDDEPDVLFIIKNMLEMDGNGHWALKSNLPPHKRIPRAHILPDGSALSLRTRGQVLRKGDRCPPFYP